MATAKIEGNTTTLVEALVEFQKDLPQIGMDSTNPAFKSKYASLGAVTKAIISKLTEHGFAFSVGSFVDNGLMVVDAHLLHESGQSRSLQFPITETNPQKIGSALTYARRYALTALTGAVADEDDDGNAASTQSAAERVIDKSRQATAARTPAGPKASKDVIRTDWIEKNKVSKEAVNAKYEEYKGAGKTAADAFDEILKTLETTGKLA